MTKFDSSTPGEVVAIPAIIADPPKALGKHHVIVFGANRAVDEIGPWTSPEDSLRRFDQARAWQARIAELEALLREARKYAEYDKVLAGRIDTALNPEREG